MGSSIVDLIIRIKNGCLAKKDEVEVPYSKFGETVLKKLETLRFIKGFKTEGDNIKKIIVALSYDEGISAITEIEVVSKPGQRNYVSYRELKPVLSGMGYSILSTSKGIMTNKEARKNKLGGELLFRIW